MNFTREPIIETIITPKEGYTLALRNSKGAGQEEYFVDAVEVITFANCCFFRSLEKPKCFLVPVSDYEIIEVREARMVLKSASSERGGIKIAGGRETSIKAPVEEEEKVPEKKKEKQRRPRKRRATATEPKEGEAEIPRPSLIPPPSTLIAGQKKEEEAPKKSDQEGLSPEPSVPLSEVNEPASPLLPEDT